MAKLYVMDVVNTALAQVGKPCGKTNEYSAELDRVKYYNYPKNGAADSCKIFCDDMVYRCIQPQTAHDARAAMYEPDSDNCGAGCSFAVSYFKKAGAWYGKMSDAHTGDEIFFYNDKYKSSQNPTGVYHTGLVVDWDNKGIYTVEGNVSNNDHKVTKRFYAYGDSRVLGFGRPNYTAYKPDDNNGPTPSPDPDITAPKYKVKVNTYLTIRNGPDTSCAKVGELYNGAIVSVYETNGSWARISGGVWVSSYYLDKM